MEAMMQHLRYGVRMLVRNPGFTAVAVITLALGIGANTAIFSAVNTVLLRGLPYEQPERLVSLGEYNTRYSRFDAPWAGTSYLNFLDWEKQNAVFERMAAYSGAQVNLNNAGGEPDRVATFAVSEGYFATVGVKPILGRGFLPEDCRPGANSAVLSYGLWQRRFAGASDIVGNTLVVDGTPTTIIGVMPAGFKERDDVREIQVWMPLRIDPAKVDRGVRDVSAIARLRPGVTLEQAQSDMATVGDRLRQQYPEANRDAGVGVARLHDWTLDFAHQPLLIMLAAVGFVLLIACANVANLLLARCTTRKREIAVRAAMGAGRSRLLGQLLTESLLLALVGAAGGLLLAPWAIQGINSFSAETRMGLPAISLDGRVLGFTLLISLLTGLIFGAAPAFETSRVQLNEVLKDADSGATASLRHRLLGALVIGEVALSLVLLICGGLLIRSFYRLLQVDPGFRTENVLTADVALSPGQYRTPQSQYAFFARLLGRVQALPGVRSAAYTSCLPWSGFENLAGFVMAGHQPPPAEPPVIAWIRYVSPAYFQTMGVALKKGRFFTDQDQRPGDPQRVIVASETFVRKYWKDRDPLGQRLNGLDGWWTIVGVVGDIKHRNLDAPSLPDIYLPQIKGDSPALTLVLRTGGNPLDLAPLVRQSAGAIDPNQPVSNVRTMKRVLYDRIAVRRLLMFLMEFFAAVALIMAVTGIYGVVSYSVSRRTREIGIRMALGARTADVLKSVLGRGSILILTGLCLGAAGAAAVTRLLSSQLFAVKAIDVPTFIVVALLLGSVALLACYLPARRATQMAPMASLRHE